jgi:hypothetical protein
MGSKKQPAAATTIDAASLIRKNHFHACKPRISSIFTRILAAGNHEMMSDIVSSACQIHMHIGFASFVYHDDVNILARTFA